MTECNCSCQPENACDCSSGNGVVMVLSCSGGSNVGQIANSAAVELDKRGIAKLYCLIGVAAHIPGMVDSAKSASRVIAIDGCPVACAKTALDHIGIPVSQHIVLTELGIEKNHVFEWSAEQVETTLNAVVVPASE